MTPRVKRRPAFRGLRKTTATAVVAWGFIGISSALAQSGNLDMDVNPDAHVAGVPAASTPAASVPAAGTPAAGTPATPAIAPEGAPAAVAPSGPTTEQADAPVSPQPDSADSNSSVFAAPSPSTPEPVSLDHPTVINTAKLRAGNTTVSLFGIEGLTGEPAQGLQAYIEGTDRHLTCQVQPTDDFVCLLSDGTDLAQLALINGAARTTPDAPDPYREQEIEAQAARRGIWVNLPPPPDSMKHPTASDTATLVADGKTYGLDGVQGLGQPYAAQLQGYIAANGDSLTCSEQSATGRYICLLPDGMDIAKIALVNGAATIAADAPDMYRLQQIEAQNNRRGYWVNPPPGAVQAVTAMAPSDQYTFIAGDDGVDGITYLGGAPVALIGGESVFLVYGDGLGWGYYDHWHHWRDAPDRYRRHMEHFHPDGHGLRGYHGDFHRDYAMHREGEFHHEEGVRREAMHPGGMQGRPDMGAHVGATGHPAVYRPGAVGHPGNMGGPTARPGMPGGMRRPGGAPPGGGFMRPNPAASAGGFHPGGMPRAMAAPAVHANVSAGSRSHH
jgi:endonuclease YncB( thermonuclease family)